ncbi:Cubilin [Orchesella cincta]|uniref:Cubilin n=1 Tax=Orchesella cincta TaxID=48709 RepID=A0A1D2M1M9_ORCCI|nr:Cubilin [Orchesella cincta]
MLAYYSGENAFRNSRGFAMVYTEKLLEAVRNCHNIKQSHHIHSAFEQTYANNEISTFVFAPLDNIHRPERKTVVSYVEDGLEPGCCGCDYLRVFKFQSTGGWADASQSVCGGSEYQKWESDDMVMILFHSDLFNVGRGFHLVHSHELTSPAQHCLEFPAWLVRTPLRQRSLLFGCGGALSESFAAISYKSDVSVNQYERCVWTIRSPTAIGYRLEVLSFGLQTELGDIGITATCLSRSSNYQRRSCESPLNLQYPYAGLLFWRKYSEFSWLRNGLHRNDWSSGIATTSKHYIVNTVQGHVRYPLDVELTYTDNEVSTFVYAPLDNIHNPERKTVVSYVEDSLEACCDCDFLKVFEFQSTGGWIDTSQNACSGTEYAKWESDDMVMILFHSDQSRVGRGFHLVHSHELASRAQQCV